MQGRLHTREDSGIRLDAEGRFWHDDVLVEHPQVLRAFHQGLELDPQGRVLLRFGSDWCVVTVEDAPYQVVQASVDGDAVVLWLDDEREVSVDPSALFASADGVLYARVPGRGGLLWARLGRAAQMQLAGALEADGEGYALRTATRATPLRPREAA